VWDKQIDNLRTNHRVGAFLCLPHTGSLGITPGGICVARQCISAHPSHVLVGWACRRPQTGQTGLSSPAIEILPVTSEFSIRRFQRGFCVVHSLAWAYKGSLLPKSRLYLNVRILARRSFPSSHVDIQVLFK